MSDTPITNISKDKDSNSNTDTTTSTSTNNSNLNNHSANNNTKLIIPTIVDPIWEKISLTDLIETNKLIFIPGDVSVEEAFNTLVKNHLNSIPVENFPGDMNCLTFDYNDLNSYLLLVLNKINVNNKKITQDCQNGKPVPVGEIVKLTPKNTFYKIPENDNLINIMKILGSGLHRVAITNPEMTFVKGILSQRRLIKYLWDNVSKFKILDFFLNYSLKDLQIGIFNNGTNNNNNSFLNQSNFLSSPINENSHINRQSRIISINGDEPLIMALYKMHIERISSIAVVDNQYNLLGNISVADVKHVTRTSQYPLLHKTCRHFISIILNSRGLETGKDSFPIFHVYPTSTLSRTLAKLVATKSHRLWIVQPPESILSQQNTGNSMASSSTATNNSNNSNNSNNTSNATCNVTNSNANNNTSNGNIEDFTNTSANFATPNLFEKEYRSGKLIGVVSLTDIISFLVRITTNVNEIDPQTARRQRGSIV